MLFRIRGACFCAVNIVASKASESLPRTGSGSADNRRKTKYATFQTDSNVLYQINKKMMFASIFKSQWLVAVSFPLRPTLHTI